MCLCMQLNRLVVGFWMGGSSLNEKNEEANGKALTKLAVSLKMDRFVGISL